jgi:hypothetical protein
MTSRSAWEDGSWLLHKPGEINLPKNVPRAKPSTGAKLQILQLGKLAQLQEDRRVDAVLAALRDLWATPVAAPRCFVDLSSGHGAVVLEVCKAFSSCSAVGWDEEIGRAVVERDRRGLQDRCNFFIRKSVEVDLCDATVVLMCPSSAGATFLLRRVLPNSGLASGSVILSIGKHLPNNSNHGSFQWDLFATVTEKGLQVFCYSWTSMPISPSRFPRLSDPRSPSSAASSPMHKSFSLPCLPKVADSPSSQTSHIQVAIKASGGNRFELDAPLGS